MKLICLVGCDGHGKTTLLEDLIPAFVSAGHRLGSIKHSGHRHELDRPGKDSFRHRAAGARPAGIVTDGLAGVFLPLADDDDPFALLAPMFSACDLVLVEGFKSGPYLKVEVFRRAAGGRPLATEDGTIQAVISDDPLEVDVPVWPRSDVPALVEKLLALAAD